MIKQSFEEILAGIVRSSTHDFRSLEEGECQSATGSRCTLCYASSLDYPVERLLKEKALQEFWKTLRLPCKLDPLVVSPRGRKYRTTTKRKAFRRHDGVLLGLINPMKERSAEPFSVIQCSIEPATHAEIYRKIQVLFDKPYAAKLTQTLNYVIIRGGDKEQTIILNLEEITQEGVRAANTLSKSLTRACPTIVGFFLYEDSRSPQYYLGRSDRGPQPRFKKLFGNAEIFHRVDGRSFLHHPLSFSQVNHSLLEKMVGTATNLLQPSRDARLFDLYCGYGLFALCLAENFHSVLGVETSPASVASAIANAKRQRVLNARFIRSTITGETIERVMALSRPQDSVLLDPPRSGTDEGVIECVAARKPKRVIHIFCEIDLIQKEVKRWGQNGYAPVRAIPLDMFPGTSTIETMILLEQQ